MKNLILTTAIILVSAFTANAANSSGKDVDVGRDLALSIYKSHADNKDFLSCLETVAFFPIRSSAVGIDIDDDLMSTIVLACDSAATEGVLSAQVAESLEGAVKKKTLSIDGFLIIIHSLYSSTLRSHANAFAVSETCEGLSNKKQVDISTIMKKQNSKALAKFLNTDIKTVLKEAHVSSSYQPLLKKRYEEIQKEISK
ncbi:hypothetical protein [Bdellovibrio sp. BCCA]|uniref:hypothetical protein n=1 Tax=Bdellovibrio sp. BCCA TaxID=3136281 RepID=UPI0030F19DAD